MMGTRSSPRKLILVKACKKECRQIFRKIFDVLALGVIVACYVYDRSALKEIQQNAVLMDQEELNFLYPTGSHSKLFYAPDNAFTEQIIENVRNKLFILPDRMTSFATVSDMEQEIAITEQLFVIAFDTNSSEKHLSYTIGTKNNRFRTDEVYSGDVAKSFQKNGNIYFDSGFLALQSAVEKSFVELRTGLSEKELPDFYYKRIPMLKDFNRQGWLKFVDFGLFLVVYVFVSCAHLAMNLTENKVTGLKQLLDITANLSYWNEIAIFLPNIIVTMLVVALITIMVGAWNGIGAQLVFFCLLLYLFVICSIAFAFFISTMLESMTFSFVLFSYFVPVVLAIAYTRVELMLTLFPMVGFMVGVLILHGYQNSGHSFHWKEALSTGYPGNERMSLAETMGMLILGSLVWTILWFYISNVRPGRYGTPKHWLFLLNKDYYQKESNRSNNSDNDDHLVKIFNLYKTYKVSSGSMINDLSLEIPKNKITILLGDNGAGKSTVMNIIAGMVSQTSGKIEIDGEDNPNFYRQRIGFCPQHNILMSYMTCWEHLIFFARLREMNLNEAEQQAEIILKQVNLQDKRNKVPANLSGGMKRRLCLAIALMGKTEVLILDEPMFGLDPKNCSDIWNLLSSIKKHYTILLSTHYLKEAEKFGDRLALMEDGKLTVCGTMELVKQHIEENGIESTTSSDNTTEQVSLSSSSNIHQPDQNEDDEEIIQPDASNEESSLQQQYHTLRMLKRNTFNSSEVMAKIKEYFSAAQEMSLADERVFAVRIPRGCTEEHARLCRELLNNSEEYGIERNMVNFDEELLTKLTKTSQRDRFHWFHSLDLPIWLIQTGAIIYKKMIYIRRNRFTCGFMFALPIIVTIIYFLSARKYLESIFSAILLHHSSVQGAFVVIVLNGNDGQSMGNDSLKNGSYFENLDLVLVENQNVEDYLLTEAKKDVTRYFDQLVAAVEFNVTDRSLKLLHNNNLLHSAGIATNIATNFLLNYYGYKEVDVRVQNIPLKRRTDIDSLTAYYFTEILAIALMLYISQYLMLPYQEASCGLRQIQNINRYLYWAATFTVDFMLHFMMCLAVYFLAINLDTEEIFSHSEHLQIFKILVLYGMPGLLMVYIISQCVDKVTTAKTISGILIFIAICAVFFLSNGYNKIKENTFWMFLLHLVPEYGLKYSLRIVSANQELRKILTTAGSDSSKHSNQPIGLTSIYIMPLLTFVVLTIVLNEIVENMYRKEKIVEGPKRFLNWVFKTAPAELSNHPEQDGNSLMSVATDGNPEECTSMIECTRMIDSINVRALNKRFRDRLVVRDLSFAVKRGECFGLLGINGAGKTSTLQMITRNLPITDGSISLNEWDVKQSKSSGYRSQFGYCPQRDALLGFMTPYEFTNYCAMMQNLKTRKSAIEGWLNDLKLVSVTNIPLDQCSRGTKRKVNIIQALLGNPPIVILDEPTTGMDFKSKRLVWDQIKVLLGNNQTVILSTHDIAECEELCNQLSFMVDGQLQWEGSILQLKDQHGNGYNMVEAMNIQQSCHLVENVESQPESEIEEINENIPDPRRDSHE